MAAIVARLKAFRLKYEKAKDHRAIFSFTYEMMTKLMAEDLVLGRYMEPGWVVALAERFSERYFTALNAYDETGTAPGAWNDVFNAICKSRSPVLEDMVFAMAAHIVQDLPYALIDVVRVDSQDASRIHDFHLVNDAMGKAVKKIEGWVFSRYTPALRPFTSWINGLSGGYSWLLTSYGISISRGMAWYNADRILDPASRERAEASLVRSVQILIEDVRKPRIFLLRVFFGLLRRVVELFRKWPAEDSIQRPK
jgi:Family of unknown function (DUF5995)